MEIEVNQDIRKYKVKDIGPFTFKQAGFLVLGAGLGYLLYSATNTLEVAIIPAGIVAAFGFLKPFGMSFTNALKLLIKELTVPPFYEYESDFVYTEEDMKKLWKKNEYVVNLSEKLIQSNADKNKVNQNQYEEDLILK